MVVRSLLVMALLIGAATIYVTRRGPQSPQADQTPSGKPWSLESAASGLTFTWDRRAPELRQASRVELVLHNGADTTTHTLDRSAGTMVIPFTPQAAVLKVDGKRFALYGSESEPEREPPPPEPSEAPPPAVEPDPAPPARQLKLPMLLSNRGHRVVSTAAVVLPRVPSYVQRTLDVDLLVKVAPQGRVASVASNYRNDPLRNRLSAVASDAVARWQFDRIDVNSYREAKIRVVFTPRGVSVRPAPVG